MPDHQIAAAKAQSPFCLHHYVHPHLHIVFLKVKASLRRYITNVKVLPWWEEHLCRWRGGIRLTDSLKSRALTSFQILVVHMVFDCFVCLHS